jgi:GGDEF domain-containing protein
MLLPRSNDPLTGLPARQSFLLGLEQAVALAHGRNQPLCVLVIHAGAPPGVAGVAPMPAAVPKIGKLLQFANGRRGELARLDTLCFALLLRDRELSAAHALALELIGAIALHYGSARGVPYVSVGAAGSPAHARWGGRDLLELALWRCVRAARAGTNQVCSTGVDAGRACNGWPSLPAGISPGL